MRTCVMYVLLHEFACIFVCICIYVVFSLVIFVCMCAYCLYVVHIGRLAIFAAKNTGNLKYMQYNTEHKNMHIICTTYIHIHAHTYTKKHQIHTRYRTYGLIYVLYLVCILYVWPFLNVEYMHHTCTYIWYTQHTEFHVSVCILLYLTCIYLMHLYLHVSIY